MRSINETINALKNGEYDDKLTYLYLGAIKMM